MKLRFKLEKDTPGTYRYQEVDDKGEILDRAKTRIPTIYIQKSAFSSKAPEFLKAVFEYE